MMTISKLACALMLAALSTSTALQAESIQSDDTENTTTDSTTSPSSQQEASTEVLTSEEKKELNGNTEEVKAEGQQAEPAAVAQKSDSSDSEDDATEIKKTIGDFDLNSLKRELDPVTLPETETIKETLSLVYGYGTEETGPNQYDAYFEVVATDQTESAQDMKNAKPVITINLSDVSLSPEQAEFLEKNPAAIEKFLVEHMSEMQKKLWEDPELVLLKGQKKEILGHVSIQPVAEPAEGTQSPVTEKTESPSFTPAEKEILPLQSQGMKDTQSQVASKQKPYPTFGFGTPQKA